MTKNIDIAKKSFVRKPSAEHDVSQFSKLPPQAIDIERNVIGACLYDQNIAEDCLSLIRAEYFYIEDHVLIWKAIQDLFKDGAPIDTLTVVEQLKKNKDLDKVGGAFTIAKLVSNMVSPIHYKAHCYILIEKFIARQMISFSYNIATQAFDPSTDILELLEKSAMDLERIYDFVHRKSVSAKAAVSETFTNIMHRSEGTEASQLYTGWIEFDEIVCLDKPRMMVVASAQKIGKTAFVLTMIKQIITLNKNIAVKWYSFEMDVSANIRRLISEYTGLTEGQLLSRSYKLSDEDKQAIKEAKEAITTYPLEITDKKQDIHGIKKSFKRFCKRNPGKTCIAVVDNHGFVVNNFEEEEIAAKGYAALRDETGGIIIVIHHLTTKNNKEFNIDHGYEPNKEMVRGNTRLLDYCNTLLLLHRPNYYLDLMRKLKLELTEQQYKAISKLFLIYCVLNRDGGAGLIRLQHDIKYSRFENFKL